MTKLRTCTRCRQSKCCFQPRARVCDDCRRAQAQERSELVSRIGQEALERDRQNWVKLGIKTVKVSSIGCTCPWCQAHPDGSKIPVSLVPREYPCTNPVTAGLLFLAEFDDEDDEPPVRPSPKPGFFQTLINLFK